MPLFGAGRPGLGVACATIQEEDSTVMADTSCAPKNLVGPDGLIHLTALAKAAG